MSTAQTPPPETPTPDAPITTTTTADIGGWMKIGGIVAAVLGILLTLYFIAFHLGAAVLSYQKFGSFLWAILDFFFPYFYYPYYAFVLSKEPAPVPESTGTMGGARKLMRRLVPLRRKTMGNKPFARL